MSIFDFHPPSTHWANLSHIVSGVCMQHGQIDEQPLIPDCMNHSPVCVLRLSPSVIREPLDTFAKPSKATAYSMWRRQTGDDSCYSLLLTTYLLCAVYGTPLCSIRTEENPVLSIYPPSIPQPSQSNVPAIHANSEFESRQFIFRYNTYNTNVCYGICWFSHSPVGCVCVFARANCCRCMRVKVTRRREGEKERRLTVANTTVFGREASKLSGSSLCMHYIYTLYCQTHSFLLSIPYTIL